MCKSNTSLKIKLSEELDETSSKTHPLRTSAQLRQTNKKVQVGKDQEKAQSEKDSHSKNRGGNKNKLKIRYLYHETYRKPNEQLFSQ